MFELPKNWYLIWDCVETYKLSLEYVKRTYTYYQNSGIRSDKIYISFSGDSYLKDGYTEITCEQFVEYVLNKSTPKQTSVKEDTSYLINFLKQNNIT